MYSKFNLSFFSYFFIIVSCFNYLLLLCIGLYSPFQLCKIKIIYCKWVERGYKYIFYVKSTNCTILSVSTVIYVIMFMCNLEINYLSIYLSIYLCLPLKCVIISAYFITRDPWMTKGLITSSRTNTNHISQTFGGCLN